MRIMKLIVLALSAMSITGALTGCGKSETGTDSQTAKKTIEITNVSYDPTREFYEAYNKEFAKYWFEKSGQEVKVTQSHGGSGKQARSVIEGNEADVVTLALSYDITAIHKAGLIEEGWQEEFDNNSSPYTSIIVFLVRKDNPQQIRGWGDLIRDGVKIITPNPESSGGARWNYLAAWAYADQAYNHDETRIKEYMRQLYHNVLVLSSGARGATAAFAENGQGDVLIAWENEAYLMLEENPEDFEIITPDISILAEPPVAVVDEVAAERGTGEVAAAYLEYLYSDTGQELAARYHYRPRNKEILARYSDVFSQDLKLVTIDDELFGGWENVQEKHFADGKIFDEIYNAQ